MITEDKLSLVCKIKDADIRDELLKAMHDILPKYSIDTELRENMFLAQCAHESGGFIFTKENLNYQARALLAIFPKYFNADQAKQYEHHPEMIANRVYANRMGNGDEQSGDGWKHRGRGFIQLTGKMNYQSFAHECDMSVDAVIPYLETVEGCTHSAAWYFQRHALLSLCDRSDLKECTRLINGGYNGLASRQEYYDQLMRG